ncbi:MAG: ABA4-like family protein [Synechococcales cyanobacterium]
MVELLFNGANWLALPFWALMIVLPGWVGTRRVMNSWLPFVALAGVYGYLLVTGFDAESVAGFSDPQLSLTDLTQLFSQPGVMAAGWVHYIVMDLFVGRWIYQQGCEKGIWTVHSLLLCLFAGPLGLLSHLLTATVTERWRPPASTRETEVTGETA